MQSGALALFDPVGGAPVATLEAALAGVAPLLPLLDALPNATLFIKDGQARYRLVNRTLVQRCGLPAATALLGRTSAEVFPVGLGLGYTEQDRQVLEEGTVLTDRLELHLHANREPGWCLTHKRPLCDAAGQVLGLAGISVDLQATHAHHPAYQRLAAVEAHIRAHFDRPIAMSELTALAEVSVAQLERYCKRIFHLTPRQLIHKARLEHAHRLLRTALPITEVALRCGYTDHSAFSRQFKALAGCTPGQYRAALGG